MSDGYVSDDEFLRQLDELKQKVLDKTLSDTVRQEIYDSNMYLLSGKRNIEINALRYLFVGWYVLHSWNESEGNVDSSTISGSDSRDQDGDRQDIRQEECD